MRKSQFLPRNLEPLEDMPMFPTASEWIKDAGRQALSRSQVVLPPLENKKRISEPKLYRTRTPVETTAPGEASRSESTTSTETRNSEKQDNRSSDFEPTVQGLVPPQEYLARMEGDFSPQEVQRMRQAFDFHKLSDSSEVSCDDLQKAVCHLGFLAVSTENVEVVVKEVTSYSALNLDEFTLFYEKYAAREQGELQKAFQRYGRSKVPRDALPALLHDMGLTSLQRAVASSLAAAGFGAPKALGLNQLLLFLAHHRSSEGFTSYQLVQARQAFDHVREGLAREEIPFRKVTAALVRFFGQEAHDKWKELLPRLRPHCDADDDDDDGEEEDEEEEGFTTPRRSVDFHQFLVFARIMQVEELTVLRAKFQLADTDRDGLVAQGEFLSTLPEDVALLINGKVETLMADAGIKSEQLSFDDVFDVLALCRITSNFTKSEVEELKEVFARWDRDSSGKIDVLELVEMLSHMGFNTSLEHVHLMLQSSDADGNDELDFKEFVHVMSTHELSQAQAIRSAFREVAPDSFCSKGQAYLAVQRLSFDPGEQQFEEAILEEGLEDVEELDFSALRSLVTCCRQKIAKAAQCRAYFPTEHVEIMNKLFKEQQFTGGNTLERGGLICLLSLLGLPVNTTQDREAMFSNLDQARHAGLSLGLSEEQVGELGSSSATFPTVLQLLRMFALEGQRRVMRRELEAMQMAKISHQEVVEFRQVFTKLAVEAKARARDNEKARMEVKQSTGRRRSMPDLSLDTSQPGGLAVLEVDLMLAELKASFFIDGKSLCIGVQDVSSMLRSLGIRINEKQMLQLSQKVKHFAAGGEGVDFAAFLQLIRWMLDANFADINGRTGTAARSLQASRPKDDAAPARQTRRRASVV